MNGLNGMAFPEDLANILHDGVRRLGGWFGDYQFTNRHLVNPAFPPKTR